MDPNENDDGNAAEAVASADTAPSDIGTEENFVDNDDEKFVEVAVPADDEKANDEGTDDKNIETGGADPSSFSKRLSDGNNFSHSALHKHKGESLKWKNVNMTLNDKKGNVEKKILDSAWGEALSGHTTAIMGSSGAGKTSLFSVLAGRATTRGRIVINAEVYVGDAIVDPSDLTAIREKIGFVAQEDNLPIFSTVREAITFSARLRLPRTISDEEIACLVNEYIEGLGLERCADSIIGGGMKKGISGGEKKRTSVAIELVTRPSIVMLDEPTSGLDSYSTEMVANALNLVAETGTTVLFTIHQPSVDVFYSFDNVILLNRGRVLYQGATKTVVDDFEKTTLPVPTRYNPADWLLRIGAVESDESLFNAGLYPEDDRDKIAPEGLKSITSEHKQGGTASVGMQIKKLFTREMKTIIRNPLAIIINCVITAVFGLIFGVIFFDVGRLSRSDPINVNAQVGAVVNVQISTLFGQSQDALQSFPQERPLFLREYATNHYNVMPYFLGKFVTEAIKAMIAMFIQSITTYFMIGFHMNFGYFFLISFMLAMTGNAVALFLGSLSPNPNVAQSLFPVVVVPQIFFSGVFLAVELIPEWVRWAQYLCALKYASALSMVYEFADCNSGTEGVICQNVLARNNANLDDAWWYWLCLLGIFAGFRGMCLVVLRKKANTFA